MHPHILKLWYALNFGIPNGFEHRNRRTPLSHEEKQLLRAKTLHQIAVNRSLKVRLPKPRYRYKLHFGVSWTHGPVWY